jgi:hypothetical protein
MLYPQNSPFYTLLVIFFWFGTATWTLSGSIVPILEMLDSPTEDAIISKHESRIDCSWHCQRLSKCAGLQNSIFPTLDCRVIAGCTC